MNGFFFMRISLQNWLRISTVKHHMQTNMRYRTSQTHEHTKRLIESKHAYIHRSIKNAIINKGIMKNAYMAAIKKCKNTLQITLHNVSRHLKQRGGGGIWGKKHFKEYLGVGEFTSKNTAK